MYFTQTFRWAYDTIIGDDVVSYEPNFMLKTRVWEYSVSIYGVSIYNIFDIYINVYTLWWSIMGYIVQGRRLGEKTDKRNRDYRR
jgi:hypothetical protein